MSAWALDDLDRALEKRRQSCWWSFNRLLTLSCLHFSLPARLPTCRPDHHIDLTCPTYTHSIFWRNRARGDTLTETAFSSASSQTINCSIFNANEKSTVERLLVVFSSPSSFIISINDKKTNVQRKKTHKLDRIWRTHTHVDIGTQIKIIIKRHREKCSFVLQLEKWHFWGEHSRR